jgi:PEGA domain-containing protein
MPALTCLLSAALAAGSAAPEGRVAVVPLDSPPELTFTGKSAADAFAAEASRRGFEVVTPAQVEEKLGRAGTLALVRCADDAKCLAAKAAPLGVARIVSGWLRKRGEAYRVALVHADARTGARLGGVEREVPIASRRLNKEIALAAPMLLAGQADAKGVLSIETTPAGALVTVDDVPVGTTPLHHEVLPGRHKVQVAATGYFDAAPVWIDVPANAIVEHKPRLYEIPARDRPNSSPTEGSGTRVRISR